MKNTISVIDKESGLEVEINPGDVCNITLEGRVLDDGSKVVVVIINMKNGIQYLHGDLKSICDELHEKANWAPVTEDELGAISWLIKNKLDNQEYDEEDEDDEDE